MRVLIKGAGDLATGIACRLYNCGFKIIMTDIAVPTTVRRTIAFSRAVYEACVEVEGIKGRLTTSAEDLEKCLDNNEIAIVVDPKMNHKDWYQADIIVDAIIAKKNIGTNIADAELVIGVGPGFAAGRDCHYVIETKRGHYLGKVITKGSAIPNTGIPGMIGGYSVERIIRASAKGVFQPIVEIGAFVKKDQIVAYVENAPVYALMTGIVRGMLQPGVIVEKGMKCGDIDSRCEIEHCYSVSDKARSIGGGVLEAILMHFKVIT